MVQSKDHSSYSPSLSSSVIPSMSTLSMATKYTEDSQTWISSPAVVQNHIFNYIVGISFWCVERFSNSVCLKWNSWFSSLPCSFIHNKLGCPLIFFNKWMADTTMLPAVQITNPRVILNLSLSLISLSNPLPGSTAFTPWTSGGDHRHLGWCKITSPGPLQPSPNWPSCLLS